MYRATMTCAYDIRTSIFSQFLSILELVTIEVKNFGHLSLVHEILGHTGHYLVEEAPRSKPNPFWGVIAGTLKDSISTPTFSK